MRPEGIFCSQFLAHGWPKLFKALGYEVTVEDKQPSGHIYNKGNDIFIFFEAISDIGIEDSAVKIIESRLGGPNQYRCGVSAIRDNDIIAQLAKSLIASGAKVTPNLPWVADEWGLMGFHREVCVGDWNTALADRASFVVEEIVNPTGALAMPQGHIEGGPVPIWFGTGPAYTLDRHELSIYLEIKLHGRTWREPRVKEFMTDLIARLKECGACPVVLWGQTQSCANAI